MKARIVLEASRLAVLLSVFLASRAGAQVLEDPETFAVERTWNAERELGIAPHLVDLSFSRSGDSLYVVGCLFCEPSNDLYTVPVIRDPETKKILELGDATVVFTGTIYHLSSAPVFGPQGTLFYSYRRAEKLAQRRGGLAGPETIFDLQSLAGPPEAGGVTFSPHLVDIATGFGLLQLSSWTLLTHAIYNVHLRPLPAGLFAPQRSELFASLPGPASGNGLAGSIRYIPSGPNSGDLLYANWNSGEIKIMVIDKATGLAVDARTGNPTLGTRRPSVLRFASGMGNGPMGLAFDPVGGDLFISTNRGNPRNAIIQIGGFPPPDEAPVDLFPAASFTIRPVNGIAPLEVQFDASASETPAGTSISEYDWDFGDGDVAEGVRVSHTYARAGRYLVTLSVTNNKDFGDLELETFEVQCPSSDIAPWTFGTVGEPAYRGAARFEGGDEDRCLVLCAGGQDIVGRTEKFPFLYREATGDVVFTTRVVELNSSESKDKVGIMLRERLEPEAPFVAMFVEKRTGEGQVRFRFSHREEGRSIRSRNGSSTELPSAWIQIRREGRTFTGLSSPDGVNWTEVKSVVLDVAEDMFVGVVATGIDSEPSASFEPLEARVCNLELSSDQPGGPVEEIEFLDLSDIVAGGDGTGAPGDGFYVGVHLDTGAFLERWENTATFDRDGVNPSPVEESDYIDSVFLLNQATMPINLAEVKFDFDSVDVFDRSWNHVLSNITGDLEFANGVIQAGDRKDLETCVSVNASAGVTFDLDALRADYGQDAVHTFSTYVGMDGGTDGCRNTGFGFMTLLVIFSNENEILMDPTTDDGSIWKLRVRIGIGAPYEAVIPSEATYLSLVSGAGDSRFNCDYGVFGNPRIHPLPESTGTKFLRGDPTADGTTNVSDSLAILNFLFRDGPPPSCMKSADVDDGGTVNLTDPVQILSFLFAGGSAPAPPFGSCGTDTEEDELTCESYPPCVE